MSEASSESMGWSGSEATSSAASASSRRASSSSGGSEEKGVFEDAIFVDLVEKILLELPFGEIESAVRIGKLYLRVHAGKVIVHHAGLEINY